MSSSFANLPKVAATSLSGSGFFSALPSKPRRLDNPDTHFAIVDSVVDKPNVASLTFAEEQGSYLVGAIAALQSKTGKIGFIGGVETDLIKKFEAGYVEGAKKINPDIEYEIKYISQPPDFSGFNDPAKAKEIALSMYDGGADVVYHAAGGSDRECSRPPKRSRIRPAPRCGESASTPISSTPSTRLSRTCADLDAQASRGGRLRHDRRRVSRVLHWRTTSFDLKSDGVGYSTSGGFVDAYTEQVEDLKQQIIDGTIVVPTTPVG